MMFLVLVQSLISTILLGYGGYGSLEDKNGVIWSAEPLLRWDTEQGFDWTF